MVQRPNSLHPQNFTGDQSDKEHSAILIRSEQVHEASIV